MNLEELKEKHEELVNIILTEEEQLIQTHKNVLNEQVDLIKKQMTLLGDVDRPGSDIDEYIFGLEGILSSQLEFMKDLKNKLTSFKGHIS